MRKILNKKAQGMATNKIVAVVLVILVIAAVLMFIFKADLLSYIKNLPGFDSTEDGELDVTQMSPDDLAKVGYKCVNEKEERVAILDGQPLGNFIYQAVWSARKLYFFDEANDVLSKSDLIVNIDEKKYIIELDKTGFNLLIGDIQGNEASIYGEYIKNYNGYEKLKDSVSVEVLEKLDRTYLVNGRLLCTSKDYVDEKERERPVEVEDDGKNRWIYQGNRKSNFYFKGDSNSAIYYSDWPLAADVAFFYLKEGVFVLSNNRLDEERMKKRGDFEIFELLKGSTLNDKGELMLKDISKLNLEGKGVYSRSSWSGFTKYQLYLLENNNFKDIGIYLTPTILENNWDIFVEKSWSKDLKIGHAIDTKGKVSLDIEDYLLSETSKRTEALKKYPMIPSVDVLKKLEESFIERASWNMYTEKEVEDIIVGGAEDEK